MLCFLSARDIPIESGIYYTERGLLMEIMRTERLTVREFTQDDFDRLFLLLSSPAVMRYCSGPVGREETHKWLDTAIRCYKEYGYDFWAVFEKDTGDFLGAAGIMNQEVDGRKEDCLAFMIGQQYWNRGYATEAAAACVRFAFESLKLERLIATAEPENGKSVNVLTKIGMTYAGDTVYAGKKAFVYRIERDEFVKLYRQTAQL